MLYVNYTSTEKKRACHLLITPVCENCQHHIWSDLISYYYLSHFKIVCIFPGATWNSCLPKKLFLVYLYQPPNLHPTSQPEMIYLSFGRDWILGSGSAEFSGFPGGTSGEEATCRCRRCKRCWLNPWVGKIPWRGAWQLSPAFLSGESHGHRSLAGYSP